MKLIQEERNQYRYFKCVFKEEGGKFITGLAAGRVATLAVLKRGSFYHVAAAVQGPNDKANKRRGRYEAMRKLYSDCYLPVPAATPFQFGTITEQDMDKAFENQNLNK